MASVVTDVKVSPSTPAAPAGTEHSLRPATEFHITGFGPFRGVPLNPTETLLNSLSEYLTHFPLPYFARIASRTVIEVSGRGSSASLSALHGGLHALHDPSSDRSPPRTVCLHLGVNVSSSRFELETQGFNEATFGCPDEAAWCPQKVCIDDGVSLTHTRCTQLPIRRLAKALCDDGFDCGVSKDAGRFVCNWVYYYSLRLSEESGCDVLFVHVPSLSSVGLNRQLAFLRGLVAKIAALA